jgi:hypothetical protein
MDGRHAGDATIRSDQMVEDDLRPPPRHVLDEGRGERSEVSGHRDQAAAA